MIKKIKKQKNRGFTQHHFYNNKSGAGFTMLETIVAILVLSLAISGAFSAVRQGLHQTIIAKDEVKAFYLAQEAIEILRNKRDTNQLTKINSPGSSVDWMDGIISVCPDDGSVCTVDAMDLSINNCGVNWGDCPVLKQDLDDTLLYNYSVGYDTKFKREIQIEIVNVNEITVVVRISWEKGSTDMEFKVKTSLFKWI